MIGKTVSDFKITRRIGSGAMGDVYLADDLNLPRRVALKFLGHGLSTDARAVQRFIREGEATSALDHPNICTIYQTGKTEDGQMFIAMPYYEGGSLRERLQSGPLSIEDAVSFGVGVADGLHRAHEKGILHRDIKPANLLLTGGGIVKVGDFGIAKLIRETKMTRTGVTVGTLAYMSPEQARGQDIDGRSDIFSLGATLYEMLTGKLPFWADNDLALCHLIATQDPTPPRTLRKDIPSALERVVLKAMAKNPDERYATMADMRDELLDVLRDIAPTRAVRIEALIRPMRRHVQTNLKAILWSVLAVALATVVVLNRQRIQCGLGWCPPDDKKGIATMPFDTSASDPEARAFAAGLASDLAERVSALAEFDDHLWIVPPDRVVNVNDPQAAKRGLGVDAVLTGVVSSESGDFRIRLSLIDAETGAAIENRVFPTSASWRNDLNNQLTTLLDVDIDPSTVPFGACTRDSSAYHSYILGRGYLRSRTSDAYDSATTAFEQAIAADSSCVTAYVGRARALFSKALLLREDTPWNDDALATLDRALRHDESSAGAYLLLGQIRSRRGQKEEAIEDFTRALELRSRDPVVLNQLALTNIELGRYDKAEEIDRLAIETNPGYFGAYLDLGWLHYALGRYDEAIAQFESARELAPDHGPTYNYLGVSFFQSENWEAATAAFERSFELGRSYLACSNLATLYYYEGRFEDAARMYELALEYNRSNHIVIGNLGGACYWIDGQRERADSLFERAIDLAEKERTGKPDDAILVSFLAGYYSVAHHEKAVEYAELSLKMAPDNPEVNLRAAQVYELIGERTKALVLLGKALDLGFSTKKVEHEKFLENLRKDPLYGLLIAKTTQSDPH